MGRTGVTGGSIENEGEDDDDEGDEDEVERYIEEENEDISN